MIAMPSRHVHKQGGVSLDPGERTVRLSDRRAQLLTVAGTMEVGPMTRSLAAGLALAMLSFSFHAAPAAAEPTWSDPGISENELKLRLAPLTKEELEAEASAWRDVLRRTVEEVTSVALSMDGASDSQRSELAKRSLELSEQRRALVSRVQVVLAELTRKGGDSTELAAYVEAVSDSSWTPDADVTLDLMSAWIGSADGGRLWLERLLSFAIVMFITWLAARFIGRFARRAIRGKPRVSELLEDFVVTMSRRVVLVIGFAIALARLGVEVTPLVAGIGAVGFIVGFALQETLNNFAAGFMILIYQPFDVGDLVTAGGVTGLVDRMTLVSTTLKTLDNQLVIVPNGAIWGSVITNITGAPTRRVDLVFGISYGDNIGEAKRVLDEIVAAHPAILKDPAAVVQLHELADSSLNFICRPWCKTEDYWTVWWDLTRTVKERFDAEGISIPFPQRDVHMHQGPA